MILFSSEKEIIFKIVNGILLLWLIAAIAITCTQIIQMLVSEPNYTYEEYKAANCYFDTKDTTLSTIEQENNCHSSYTGMNYTNKSSARYEQIALYSGIANIIIVGGVMFLLNKKKKK